MYPGRTASSAGGGIYHAPLRAGALSDPAAVGAYSSAAYAAVAAAAHGYVPFTVDSVAFYPSLQSSGDSADSQLRAALSQNCGQPSAAVGWPYSPANLGVYTCPAAAYVGLDPRRKNATRESTSTLKAWLYEHIKNPYPTKGEKIMLAIITKMTLTQVSTWFANARRRLKKENKMQWLTTSGDPDRKPRDDDDVDDDVSDYNDVSDYDLPSTDECRSALDRRQMALAVPQSSKDAASRLDSKTSRPLDTSSLRRTSAAAADDGSVGSQYPHNSPTAHFNLASHLIASAAPSSVADLRSRLFIDARSAFSCVRPSSRDRDRQPEVGVCDVTRPMTSKSTATKPRIWCIAEVATSPDNGPSKPPTGGRSSPTLVDSPFVGVNPV